MQAAHILMKDRYRNSNKLKTPSEDKTVPFSPVSKGPCDNNYNISRYISLLELFALIEIRVLEIMIECI